MVQTTTALLSTAILLAALLFSGCGDDDAADSLGVAAQCTATDECDTETNQACLLDFKGGYCGIEDCVSDEDCPGLSACVIHDNGTNYCFRTCVDKAECNRNRDADNEANCSGNITFVDVQEDGVKACVPPSG